ncbi:transcriptional regulator [Lysinibacillus mangiferihumi]|uniref:Transcriptional regulator n=1 Tax=Lysinibacillus mangiferihumi TaxID=1130819 RepID=A0A4U2YXA5_9BACI|nr:transcriptional regulator [Lysinibacillus mangiferihumi]TKI66267.1 transcriptional regulator [Lysinibacillus mangiferihumi]
MAHYREGYELYCKKCEQFNLEPINFYYFMNKLSQEQLEFYNEAAHERKLLA